MCFSCWRPSIPSIHKNHIAEIHHHMIICWCRKHVLPLKGNMLTTSTNHHMVVNFYNMVLMCWHSDWYILKHQWKQYWSNFLHNLKLTLLTIKLCAYIMFFGYTKISLHLLILQFIGILQIKHFIQWFPSFHFFKFRFSLI